MPAGEQIGELSLRPTATTANMSGANKFSDPSSSRQLSSSLTNLQRRQHETGEHKSGHVKLTQANKHKHKAANINYWNYKQTGIKSRPIKLLKHPIEHIERKIIVTYLLSFLFKLIAVLTGPLIVLFVYLLTVPFTISRRLTWFVLNLSFICDANIKTTPTNRRNKSSKRDKTAAKWSYCPLSYIESYWFREKLVNNVILVLDNREAPFSIDKLRQLVRDNILSNAAFRKFSSRVVAKGIPFYKSYYWRHVHFEADFRANSTVSVSEPNSLPGEPDDSQSSSPNGSLQTSVDQFSVTSIVVNSSSLGSASSRLQTHTLKQPVDLEQSSTPPTLSDHIYLDTNLAQVNAASIRQYAYSLLNIGLNMRRPLWELRAIPSTSDATTYLIFRCHQSLADGRSLTKILTDCLSSSGSNQTSDYQEEPAGETSRLIQVGASSDEQGEEGQVIARQTHDKQLNQAASLEPDETQLKPVKERRSFVAKMSKSNSWRSAIFVGPLTVMLWVIWTFTRRKHNHLNRCLANNTPTGLSGTKETDARRFYMAQYSLTKFYQIKQMTRSTVSDVILCALSGALREYLRQYNGVTNPPNLNISLLVDMRQSALDRSPEQSLSSSSANQRQQSLSSSPSVSSSYSQASAEQVQQHAIEPHCIRPADTGEALLPGGPAIDLAEQVNCALVNVPLPVSVDGTVPRLWEVRNTMEELRTSADPWVMLGLQRLLFAVLPVGWYQQIINYISLRNSSTIVSNLRGPANKVEAWCVDLLQRAIYESQQPACAIQPQFIEGDQPQWWPDQAVGATGEREPEEAMRRRRKRQRSQQNHVSRLKLLYQLGSVTAIYYCLQPPTSNIPISFNCITYHNKLFITSLSRSLLVEDSKLLLRLFFRQLDQLANTIAKRRSLLTIIRTPVPIEISCQPASPLTDQEFSVPADNPSQQSDGEQYDDVSMQNDESIDDERELHSEPDSVRVPTGRLLGLGAAPKDDIEANIGASTRTNKCSTCKQSVCTCRRRKSLFNFDYNKQRAVNLLSLLHPAHFIAMRTSRSQESEQVSESERSQPNQPNECLCGKQLLEELDEEGGTVSRTVSGQHGKGGFSSSPDAMSAVLSEGGGRIQRQRSANRACCAKCRLVAAQSTLSLDTQADRKKVWSAQMRSKNDLSYEQNIEHSNLSIDSKPTNQLTMPKRDRLESKQHSRSETDLLPSKRGATNLPQDETGQLRRGSKESWFNIVGRRSYRKLSMFSKLSQRDQTSLETPVEMVSKQSSVNTSSSKRRQSVATSTGTSFLQHKSMVVVKDEINADVSLRYQLDGQSFLGIRNRRFSTIGSAVVGTQRRASLIPFGLMQNSSFPKLFLDDAEAHV